MATTDTLVKPTVLPWVQGNKLTLALPLQIVYLSADGKTKEEYTPPARSAITIVLRGKFRSFNYAAEIVDGNVLRIVDNGDLPVDSYSVIIAVVEPNGTKRRCKWNYIINVYDSTDKVLDYFDDFPDWGSGAILEGSVFFTTAGGMGEQEQADWTETDDTLPSYIKHKPTLAAVATSGSYNDLSNKPTIPASQIQSDWNQQNPLEKDFIKNKPIIPEVDVALSDSELDTIWNTVVYDLFSFSIRSRPYQASRGMTWLEWVASEYNVVENPYTGKGSVNDGKFYVSGDYVCITVGYQQTLHVGDTNGDVRPQSAIMEDYEYTLPTN